MTELLIIGGIIVVGILFLKKSDSAVAAKARGAVSRLIGTGSETQQK